MNRLLSTLIMLLTCCYSSFILADVYKYIDQHGLLTLTDRPRQHGQYKRLVRTWSRGWIERPSQHDWRENQRRYDRLIRYFARAYSISPALLHAIIHVESAYNPKAVSRAGAVGLMQLMPATALRYNVENRKNPVENMRAGARYLHDLFRMFDDNLILVLSAYNAGENAVRQYGNKVPPYKETHNYIRKVMGHYKRYQKTMS